MFRLKRFEVWASEIAGFLNTKLIGTDFLVAAPSSIRISGAALRSNAIGENGDDLLLLTDTEENSGAYKAYLLVPRPELALAYVLREFFATKPAHTIHATAVVSDEAVLGRNVKIGIHSVIGPDVEIGDNSVIMSNVVINGPVSIGKNCVIKDGAIIGSEGWGFVFDEDGIPFHPPQLGKIIINENVWIGSNSTIERAMVADTVISANVKIDDLVHIGGGSVIGHRAMITAGSIVAYNVNIGDDVTISPQAVIREHLNIAGQIYIGQGAVVVDDLSVPGIYVGNPARFLRPAKNVDEKKR